MFNNKGKQETQKQTNSGMPTTSSASCVISAGTYIEGTFKSTEDVRLDGTIVGEVKSDKRLVMGKSGKIEGNVFCNESSIKGKIEGMISVNGLLHLLNTAFIKGKIKAKKMVVDEGASYNGECLIGEQHFNKKAVNN